nr:4394_t:CDS:2 [Entrophospora candida]
MLQHFAWPGDQIPSNCNKCENCQHQIKESPELIDVKEDVICLVEIVTDLVKEIDVSHEDVIGTFLQHLLDELIMEGFIKEIVTIQKLSVNCSRLYIDTKVVGIEEVTTISNTKEYKKLEPLDF